MRAMRLTPDLVARCFRPVPEPDEPPEGWTPLDEDALAARAAELDAEAGPGPLWIFAYGSLIWKPVFAPMETRRAVAAGWRRSFCIELTSWRGTPDAPGLMMALEPGGSCAGLAYRLDPARRLPDLVELVRRETPYLELTGNARWIQARSAGARFRALAFYANPTGLPVARNLSPPETAARLAQACGYAGSCAEYLYNTVLHLEAEGIRDRALWRLQDLVAEEIAWRTAPKPQAPPGGGGPRAAPPRA